MRIGIDVMGGDNAPLEIIKGAAIVLENIDPKIKIVLFGDNDQIKTICKFFFCISLKFFF